MTSIGDSAFSGCSSLKKATMPAFAIEYIPQQNLEEVIITSGESIGDRAFYGCSSLTSVTIGDGVTSIDDYTFKGCSSLTNVTIGNGVTSIDSWAFSGCSSLTEIKFKDMASYCQIDGLDNVDQNKVYIGGQKLTEMTSIVIPDGVTYIGNSAFIGCSSIKKATMPAFAIEYIPQKNLEEVIITSGESIGDRAFYGCSTLTSITIPDSVTSIGGSAFYNCSSLTRITIPDSVTSIGSSAFHSCSSLTSVTIPDSVTSIGSDAFWACRSLTDITYEGTKAQWNAIYQDVTWNYNTGNYTVHCTDGDI